LTILVGALYNGYIMSKREDNMEKLMPTHNNSYDSYRYQLLKSTKTKRLETWDNEYAVHYLVDDNANTKNLNNWKSESFYFLDEAERFYDSR
tara:strand:+ start:220 stop:495 length:276 start_codon:yes stop_codon:yes gene_type:complete